MPRGISCVDKDRVEGVDAALGQGIVEQGSCFRISPVTEPVFTMALQLPHEGQGCLGHVKIAVEIGLQGRIEMRLGQILDPRGVQLKGRVVDEDIDPAEFALHPLHGGDAEGPLRDIAGDQQAFPALHLQFDRTPGRFGIRLLVEIEDRDVSALPGEKRTATALPMPESAPVMTATLSFSLSEPR